ncbi:MAG TPA: phosphoribosylformylglycinamidine synthase subunit PurS [Chloroflexota bacterium]
MSGEPRGGLWLVAIDVTLKPVVNDPQGLAVLDGLRHLGFTSVRSVRVGKHLEVRIEASSEEEVRRQAEEMCARLLANPVIETYRYEVVRL